MYSPQNFQEPSLEDREARIKNLNLDPIKVKLMDHDEGEGWSREQCDIAEKWYKRFLLLNYMYPKRSIVPTKEIDLIWHYHILDTQKYAEDCERVAIY